MAYFKYKYNGKIDKNYNRLIVDEAQDMPLIDFIILKNMSSEKEPIIELYGDINQYIFSQNKKTCLL